MTTRGRMTLNIEDYLDRLVDAEKDVDEIVTEMLDKKKYAAFQLMYDTLRNTSEQWTGETARTLFIKGPNQDGNYIYIEIGANTAAHPAAFYKEYGRTRQAAEPFLRPTLIYYRRGGFRPWMEAVMERFGLQTT